MSNTQNKTNEKGKADSSTLIPQSSSSNQPTPHILTVEEIIKQNKLKVSDFVVYDSKDRFNWHCKVCNKKFQGNNTMGINPHIRIHKSNKEFIPLSSVESALKDILGEIGDYKIKTSEQIKEIIIKSFKKLGVEIK